MASNNILGFAAILMLSVVVLSYADPGHHHTKHIIHAPLHIKLIHHHKIVKVPVVFRKHLHHHKHFSHENVYIPLKEKPKPVYEEIEDSGYGGIGGGGGGGGGGNGGDDYPKYTKSHKSDDGYNSYESDSSESVRGGDYASQGQYESHIGGGSGFSSGGGGYSSGLEKSEDNSYEYDDSQETGAYSKYQFHRIR